MNSFKKHVKFVIHGNLLEPIIVKDVKDAFLKWIIIVFLLIIVLVIETKKAMYFS